MTQSAIDCDWVLHSSSVELSKRVGRFEKAAIDTRSPATNHSLSRRRNLYDIQEPLGLCGLLVAYDCERPSTCLGGMNDQRQDF